MLARRLRASRGRVQLWAEATSSSAGGTIVVPSGCSIGDLLVLSNVAGNLTSTIPTTVVPTGFTSISNVNATGGVSGDGYRAILSMMLATSDPSGTTLTCMNGASFDLMALVVYRGRTAFATATAYDAAGEMVAGTPSSQTINASGGTPPLVAVATGIDVTFAEANNATDISSLDLRTLALEGGPGDYTVSAGNSGEIAYLQSCYIQLTY